MFFDQTSYLPDNLLERGDRMMMAHSVEGRFPYLDHQFVAFAGSLPKKYKIPGLRDKLVLREAFRSLLPKTICHRPKFAYQAPGIRAFLGVGGRQSDLVDQYLNPQAIEDAGLFKPKLVAGLLRKIAASKLARLGTRDNMAMVQILSSQILYDQFIRTDLRRRAANRMASLVFTTRIQQGAKSCNMTR